MCSDTSFRIYVSPDVIYGVTGDKRVYRNYSSICVSHCWLETFANSYCTSVKCLWIW